MRGPRYGVTCSACLLVTLPRTQLDTAWFLGLLILGNLGMLLALAVTRTSTAHSLEVFHRPEREWEHTSKYSHGVCGTDTACWTRLTRGCHR
jgi:hypothetical protein